MYCVKNRLITILIMVLIGALTACSTPNIKPFADQTVAISNLVTKETTELSQAMDRGLKIDKSLPQSSRILSKDGCLCSDANTISLKTNSSIKDNPVTLTPDEAGIVAIASSLCVKQNNKKKVFDATKKVTPAEEYKAVMDITDELFTALTKYSVGLVSLAESGQKGEESLKQLEANLNKAAAVIGVVDPVTGGGVAIVNKTTVFIAKQATIFQTNKALRKSMESAHPTLIKVAKQYHDVFYPNAILAINAFHTLEDAEIDKYTPGNATKLKKKEVTFENNAFAQLCTCLEKNASGNEVAKIICSTPDESNCFSKVSYDNYVAFKEFMNKYVTPAAEDIAKQRKRLADWKVERIKNMKAIDKLLSTWVAGHQRVIGVLSTCKSGTFKQCVDYKSLDLEVMLKKKVD